MLVFSDNLDYADMSTLAMEYTSGKYTFWTDRTGMGTLSKNQNDIRENLYGDCMSLESFIQEMYLPFVMKNKRSWRTDERYAMRHIIPHIGGLKLSQIDTNALYEWRGRLLASGLSSSTCYRLFWLAKYILNCAVRWNVLADDAAFRDAQCPREQPRRPEVLTGMEKERLLDLLARHSDNVSARAIHLLFLTGASKSEILYARWKDVNLRQRVLVTRRTPSGGKRSIPLSFEAVRLIRTFPRRDDVPWLFFHMGSGKRVVSLFSFWNKLRNELGRPALRLNDLRHVFVRSLMQKGANYEDVCSLLGHYSAEVFHLQSQIQGDQVGSVCGGSQ
ncbi:site-specific integrase [uncultured Mailhella sp.]|uniref:tyrosine-type recombinase/integrase n=1 Tax=uncultured Mailhella sp. TaxID=1981031 RepID=UPI0025FAE2D7|nr:site-specific integrase [uncultured Mailhella sp.]